MIKTISGLVIIDLGVLLGATGLLFRLMHWPDVFRGVYTGPVLIVVGLIWIVVCAVRPAASSAPQPQLRSELSDAVLANKIG